MTTPLCPRTCFMAEFLLCDKFPEREVPQKGSQQSQQYEMMNNQLLEQLNKVQQLQNSYLAEQRLWFWATIIWHLALLACTVLATYKLWRIERCLQSRPSVGQPGERYQASQPTPVASHECHSRPEATQPGPPRQSPTQESQKPGHTVVTVPTGHEKYLPRS